MSRLRSRIVIALSMLLLLGCGSDFALREDLDMGSVSGLGLACELNAFATTYKPFLTKCAGCHVPGGTGAGAFSSSNIGVAYDAFLLASTTKIDERSTNQNHAPGITGPQNQAAIDGLRPQFDNAIASCSQGPTPGDPSTPAITSAAKDIVTAQATQTLTWNLASDLNGRAITGATFSITVRSTTQASGAILYTVSQPRITTTSQGVHVVGLMFSINGNDLPLVTTFSRVDQTVNANQTNAAISNASAAFETPAPGATPNRLSLSFKTIEPR